MAVNLYEFLQCLQCPPAFQGFAGNGDALFNLFLRLHDLDGKRSIDNHALGLGCRGTVGQDIVEYAGGIFLAGSPRELFGMGGPEAMRS